jgi:short-subunit dehydrogenase
MKERGRGGILLTGSLAGYVGSSSEAIYGAAKAFNRIFAEGLWIELQAYGVDVLHLVLGVTRTPAMERAGLNFDLPGMVVSEPADVAREGLANLANGPVHVVSGNEAMVEARGRFDRAKLVRKTDAILKKLLHP